MPYNLIEERWIPVQRASGTRDWIAPPQIAEREDPSTRIDWGRPDFDAAVLEVLIGLMQTVFAPSDERGWEDVYENGVPMDRLAEKMGLVREAFALDGDGPRFFQDLTVHDDERRKAEPVRLLLIDQGVADDASLFAKSGRFEQLGFPAAAAAVATIQLFAPLGGAGIRTSLRGGGPLSVTLRDTTLLRTIWCNVLDEAGVAQLPGSLKKDHLGDKFPWMKPTRTSEKGQRPTYPEDIHPLQHFWGLPRRYRFAVEEGLTGTCDITGGAGAILRQVWSRPSGTNYKGPFVHPLTAYAVTKEDEPPNPKKGGSGLSYRDWPLLHMGDERSIPARVLEVFYRQERWRLATEATAVARGYAMENMKPLRMHEAETPVLHVASAALPEVRRQAVQLVHASESVRRTLYQQVRAAWSDRPSDVRGDVAARTDEAFWSETEPAFYRALREIAVVLQEDSDEPIARTKTMYLDELRRGAQQVFDALVPLDVDLGSADLARVVRARRSLDRFTSPDELASSVGLAAPEGAPPEGSKRKRRRAAREAT